jgi:AraC-like DNA-binding protein
MIFVLAIGLFQVSVALMLMFTFGKLKNNEKFLALFFVFALMHFILKLVFHLIPDSFLFNNLITCFVLGYGPTLFSYVVNYYKLRTSVDLRIHWTPLLIASIIYVFLIVAVLFFDIYDQREIIDLYKKIMVVVFSISVLLYGLFTSIMVYQNKHRYRGFEWKRLFAVSILLGLPSLILIIMSQLGITIAETSGRIYIYSSLTIISILLIQHLYALNKKGEWIARKNRSKGKYYNSSISPDDLENMAKILNKCMQFDKPWLNDQLSLDTLSKVTGLSKHHITQVCNNYFHKTFYQYVNEFRVEKAKKMISDWHNKRSLLDIAYDCGFSSKSSFNRYFKTYTNTTPSSFRKPRKEILNK